ncbi:hypothetical protein JRO89_XS02G0196700 [Xanthoceras sorbifolium]|uniref:Myb-like domain-containing protein n=1 Tax=Xanthoceras sorbifolium TaxID=99658 RepID=A0ABQ8IGP1_9ROSI|nr:hypothetical protein JRO89_XS02G0196700 [Xanthoceras sorbifolium]
MGKKESGKKGHEEEKNTNEEPSTLREASQSENELPLSAEDGFTKVKDVIVQKKKKRKRDKGGDDFTEVKDVIDVESGKEREQLDEKMMENVDNSRKKKKRKKNHSDDLTAKNPTQNREQLDEKMMQNVDNSRKKKKKRKKDHSDDLTAKNPTQNREQLDEKMMENVDNSRKKKKRKKNHSDDVTAKNPSQKETSKKVSFSEDVEVFPPPDGLVRGKRFSPQEDEMVKKAVLSYIESRRLGEEGIDMVLNCRSHPEVKNCWKEIGAALPWRPHESIYYRAHIIFERDENRKWSPEELELVRQFHEKHGSDWKMLAGALGKHRFHVKDAWRRIRLPNMKKGQWSQEEYQNLFDLVNLDLCKWADTDDYYLVSALFALDACCTEDVDWDNLLEHRSGSICRKRWNQMVKHLGPPGSKSFAEQVEVLSQRYCMDVLEAREAYNSRPAVDEVTSQEDD